MQHEWESTREGEDGWDNRGEDKEGGGVSVAHQWFGTVFAPFSSVSAGGAINIYNRHHKNFHVLDVHNVVANAKWRAWLAVLSGLCVLRGCSTPRGVPLTQLFVSSDRSFSDAAPLPRWPQPERRKDSTCPSTWALLWGWHLGYLYLAEFQVRDVMNRVSKNWFWFCLYSVFKANISQETVSAENAW